MSKQIARLGILFLIGTAAGAVANALGLPLAWMIGPMLATATLAISGWSATVPRALRAGGQTIVATGVGLYFTPNAVAETVAQAPYMVGAAFGTIAIGCVGAVLLARLAQTDAATAVFASIPGGPVEMAQMAEQAHGDGAAVALAQTLRIAAIVLLIPPALLWFDEANPIGRLDVGPDVVPLLLPVLFLMAVGGGLLFWRLRIANPFFLGPLAASAVLTASDIELSGVPAPLLFAGQILLGVSLGVRFDRALLNRAPRFVAAAFLTMVVLLGGCVALAWAIAVLADHPLPEMILATAPGSITEMALTAKTLGLGVASVTAYHIVRIFIIIPLTPYMLRFLLRRRHRRPGRAEADAD